MVPLKNTRVCEQLSSMLDLFIHLQRLAISTLYFNPFTQMLGPFLPSSKTSYCLTLHKSIHPNAWTLSSIFKRLAISTRHFNLFTLMVGPFHPSSKTSYYHSHYLNLFTQMVGPFHPSSKTSYCHSLLQYIHPNGWTLSSIFKD